MRKSQEEENLDSWSLFCEQAGEVARGDDPSGLVNIVLQKEKRPRKNRDALSYATEFAKVVLQLSSQRAYTAYANPLPKHSAQYPPTSVRESVTFILKSRRICDFADGSG